MLNDTHLNDKSLQSLMRSYKPEEIIFQQGVVGTKMYIITEGLVRVYQTNNNHRYLMSVFCPGEVLGEKAILTENQKYTRNFTAEAKTAVSLLEIGVDELHIINAKWPDFYLRVLKMVEERLDKANELAAILRSIDSVERVVGYLLYYYKHINAKLPKGYYVNMTCEEVRLATNVDSKTIEWVIKTLTESKILANLGDGFILSDHKRLEEYLKTLTPVKKKVA